MTTKRKYLDRKEYIMSQYRERYPIEDEQAHRQHEEEQRQIQRDNDMERQAEQREYMWEIWNDQNN